MPRRLLGPLVFALGLAGATGCTGDIDLKQALAVTDVFSGYYDNGYKDGQIHLVPSMTFRLKNQSAQKIPGIEIDAAFWAEGQDGEMDSVSIRALANGLAPGAATEPLTIRSKIGFTLSGTRDDFFGHSRFKDVTARMFAKRSGRIFPLGEFKMERRIIPHAGARP
jgi:hypothetical protein